MIDFYDVDSIAEEKLPLLNKAGQLILMAKQPQFPRRHDGDGRITREIDDHISILHTSDGQKMLNNLP